MDPNQFAKTIDQSGQIPMMVAEVARRKALAVVLDKAEVIDTAGNEVDLNDFVTPRRRRDSATAEVSTDLEEVDDRRGPRPRIGRTSRSLTSVWRGWDSRPRHTSAGGASFSLRLSAGPGDRALSEHRRRRGLTRRGSDVRVNDRAGRSGCVQHGVQPDRSRQIETDGDM